MTELHLTPEQEAEAQRLAALIAKGPGRGVAGSPG